MVRIQEASRAQRKVPNFRDRIDVEQECRNPEGIQLCLLQQADFFRLLVKT